jgi:hypothetical protein
LKLREHDSKGKSLWLIVDHYSMDSTSQNLAKAGARRRSVWKMLKNQEGCPQGHVRPAKAITWTLLSSKALSTHNASTKDTCDSQTITRTTDA